MKPILTCIGTLSSSCLISIPRSLSPISCLRNFSCGYSCISRLCTKILWKKNQNQCKQSSITSQNYFNYFFKTKIIDLKSYTKKLHQNLKFIDAIEKKKYVAGQTCKNSIQFFINKKLILFNEFYIKMITEY